MKKIISAIMAISMIMSLFVFSTTASAAEGNIGTVNFAGTTTYYSTKGAQGQLEGKFTVTKVSVDEDTGMTTETPVDYTIDNYTDGNIVYEIDDTSVISSINTDGSFTTAGYGYTVVTAKVYDADSILKAQGSGVITVFNSFIDGQDNVTNIKDLAWKEKPEDKENFSSGDPTKQFETHKKDKAVSLMLDDGKVYASTSNLTNSFHTQNTDPEDENHTVMSPTDTGNMSAFWFYGSNVTAWNPTYLGWQSKERVTNIWFHDNMTNLDNPFMSFTHNQANISQGIKFGYNGDAYAIYSSQNYATKNLGDASYVKITDVKRSKGWHQVVLVTENAKFLDPEKNVHAKFYIDGQLVLATDIYTETAYNMMVNAIALKTTTGTKVVTETVQTGIDEEGNPIYEEKSKNVTTYNTYYDELYSVELTKPVEISVMPENGAKDVPVETKFEINFGREITNKDAITVTCDGAAVTPAISQNAGKVIIDCGVLKKDADYVITVGDTVAFADGAKMPENLVFTYKTAADSSITDLMGRQYEVLGSKYISFADSTKSVQDYGMDYVYNYEGFEAKIEDGAVVLTKKATLADGSANTKDNHMMLNYLNSIDPQTADGQPKSGIIDRYVIKYKAKLGNIPQNELTYTRPISNLYAGDENVYNTAYFRPERIGYFNMFTTNVVGAGDNQRLRSSATSTKDLVKVNDMVDNWVEVCYVVDINNWKLGNNATITVSVNDGPESTEVVNTSIYNINKTKSIEKLGRLGMYFLDGTRTADAEMSVKDFEIYALQKKYDYNNLTVKSVDSDGIEADITRDDVAAGNLTANVYLDVLNNNDLIPEQEFTATVVIYSGDEMKLVTAAKGEKTVTVGNYDTIKVENVKIPTPEEGETYTMSIYVWDNYDNLVPLVDKIEF